MAIDPSLILQGIALFRSGVLGSLLGSDKADRGDAFGNVFSEHLRATQAGAQASGTAGLSATGRNLALFDPEAAYRMMSLINNREMVYKAQHGELNEMKAAVAQMQAVGHSLGASDIDTADEVQAVLKHFVERYNAWRERFNASVADGGLLEKVRAAEQSLYQLEQNVVNRFFGAAEGVRGLAELGIRIDPTTRLATLDEARLHATLDANLPGALAALREFSANFAKSAALLNAENNFIPNMLGNLNRAIQYIDGNRAKLTQEFGTGDAPIPTAAIARALAAYKAAAA